MRPKGIKFICFAPLCVTGMMSAQSYKIDSYIWDVI